MHTLRGLLLLGLLAPATTLGATFTVNVTDDLNDAICDATHCSLREAMAAANSTSGADAIEFDIPGSGVRTIQPLSALPTLSDASGVSIDGLTQPGAAAGAPLVEISGVSCGSCIGINASTGGLTLRGLVVNRFSSHGIRALGGSMTVEACFVGIDATGTTAAGNGARGIDLGGGFSHRIGGPSPSQRNVISGNGTNGIDLTAFVSNTVIQGNYIGTDATGSYAVRNQNSGIRDLGWSFIGGAAPGAGNVISGNGGAGITTDAIFESTTIQGNLIGLDATGTIAIGNLGSGIHAAGVSMVIGGTSAAERNYIAGNAGAGIFLPNRSQTIRGNWIGIAVDGTPIGNGSHGIHASGTATSVIGGTLDGAANWIEGNDGAGIYVQTAASVRVGPNVIRSNGGLGVDLGTLGVTPNDALDGDTGANSLLNFPVILSATATTVSGLLSTEASQTFGVSLITTSSCDPSGSGEAETFVTEQLVTTDTAGAAVFSFTLTSSLAPGIAVTAITRDTVSNETSELAPCVVVPDSDVTLAIADALDPVTFGDSISWTIVVTNNGPFVAEDPVVTDTLPADVDFVSVTPSQGSCIESGGTVDCSLGPIAVGEVATVTIVGTPTTCCSVTNTAYLILPEDPDGSNDSASEFTFVNRRPTADSQVVNTMEDVAIPVSVTGADPDGTTPQFVLATPPANGSLLGLLPNVTYAPDPGFHGTDAFTFETYDGLVPSLPATVTISVANVEDAPIASDDAYAVAEGTTLTVATASGVLLDDDDQDGDPITAELMTTVANGTLALQDDGGFVYTPDPDFYGSDSFTYRATDGALFSGVATVTMTIANVADGPVAAGDAYATTEDVPLVIAAEAGVLANDADVDVLSGQSTVPGLLTAAVVAAPANGTLTLSADGAFLYVPDADASGPDSFTYEASDGALTSAEVTVIIDVTAAPDAPSAPAGTGPADAAELESGDVTLTWTAATDADGDALTYRVTLLHGEDVPLELETTGTSISRVGDDALGAGTWTWTVVAIDGDAQESPPSPVSSFVVAPSGGGDSGGGCGCALERTGARPAPATLVIALVPLALVFVRRRRAPR